MAVIYALFFLLWPFGSLFFSLKNYSKKWTKNIIWAFVIFYGYTFVLSNDTMDANRLKSKFEFFKYNNFDLTGVINYFFLYNKDGVDVIQPIILYLTSLFTSDFQVLMAVLAIIFGFFYSRNIAYLLDRKLIKVKPYNYIILLLFIIVIAFWQINGFRFWASAHIFFYAVIPYIYENKKNKLWLLPFVALLHFSFLLPIAVFIIYLIIKDRSKVLFYLFLASFLIGSVNTEVVGDFLLNFLPTNFGRKIQSYTSSKYAEEVFSAETSISAYLRHLVFQIINISFVLLYFFYKKQIKSKRALNKLFTFSILIMTVGNLASLIPSGDRFQILSGLFSLSFLFFFIQKDLLKGRLKVFLKIASPLLVLALAGYIRIGFNTINIIAIIGNPISLFLIDSKEALIELL